MSNNYAFEAEQAVLGGVMLDNKMWVAVSKILSPEDFYNQAHKIIFETIAKLASCNENFDALCIEQKLKDEGKLEDERNNADLLKITHNTPSIANIIEYTKIVKQKNEQRKLANELAAMQPAINQNNIDAIEKHLDQAQKIITEIRGGSDKSVLKVVNVFELLQAECKPREFILSPWLATQSLSMLYAYRGIAKRSWH